MGNRDEIKPSAWVVYLERSLLQWELVMLVNRLKRPLPTEEFCDAIRRMSAIQERILILTPHSNIPTNIDLCLLVLRALNR